MTQPMPLPAEVITVEEKREWIFTFGQGQRLNAVNSDRSGWSGAGISLADAYYRIFGTYDSAREEMVRRFGNVWAFQYASEDEAGVKQFGLVELRVGGRR